MGIPLVSRIASNPATRSRELNPGQIAALVSSTRSTQVFLHRTFGDNAQSILRSGLKHAFPITSTATWSPQDHQRSLLSYNSPHKGSTHVVIIELPISIQSYWAAKTSGDFEGIDGLVIDFLMENNQGNPDVVPPRFIRGYLEVTTGRFTPNPNFSI